MTKQTLANSSPRVYVESGLVSGTFDAKQWGCWKSHGLLLKRATDENSDWVQRRERLDVLWKKSGRAKTDAMSEAEFVDVCMSRRVGSEAEIGLLFQLLDRDQDGYISSNEFVSGMMAMAPTTVHDISKSAGQLRLQFIFLFYDSDRDGLLSLQELSLLLDHLHLLSTHANSSADGPRRDAELLISMYSDSFGFAAFYECVACSMLSGTSLLLRLPADISDPISPRPRTEHILPVPTVAPVSVSPEPLVSTPRRSFRASEIDPRRGVGYLKTSEERISDEREFGKLKSKLNVLPGVSGDPKYSVPLRVLRQLMDATVWAGVPGRGGIVEWDKLLANMGTESEIVQLCDDMLDILKQEDSLVDVKLPCRVYGDIHGNLPDLVMMFNSFSWPDRRKGDILSMNYAFIGDWVDRGRFSVEVVVLLFCLKLLYPRNIHLIRGNHEDRVMNAVFGFRDSCIGHFGGEVGDRIWSKMNDVFEYLPLAGIVEKQVLLIHGGIGENITSVDNLRNIRKPIFIPSQIETDKLSKLDKIIIDALWSDPTDNDSVLGVHLSPRGQGACRYGPDRVEEFCVRNGLKMIIRAHECVQRGYEYFAQGRLITVFSATSYCNQFNNDAAMIVLLRNDDGSIEEHPLVLKAGHADSVLGWVPR